MRRRTRTRPRAIRRRRAGSPVYLGPAAAAGFWALVVWGTVYAVLFAFAALTEGPSRALARAVGQSTRAWMSRT